MSVFFRATAFALCAALAACSTVNSSPIPPLSSSDDRTIFDPPTTPATSAAGIAYFLPRQLARVTVKRTETTLADAIKLLGEKELALSVANAKVAAAQSGIKDSEDLLVAKGDIPAIRDLLLARIKEQKDALPIIAKAASDAKDGRAKAADTVAGVARPGGAASSRSRSTSSCCPQPPIPATATGFVPSTARSATTPKFTTSAPMACSIRSISSPPTAPATFWSSSRQPPAA